MNYNLKTLLLVSLCFMGQWSLAQQYATSTFTDGEKRLVSIASYTASGSYPALSKELHAGLAAGLTINEIKEALVHLYAYAGFPRSIRGLQTFMEVLKTRQAQGIQDTEGRIASPIVSDSTKYERGKKVLGELLGRPQSATLAGYAAFAPTIDVFLKEHLFADLFERDVLTYAQRELVTISVLATIGHAEPMLQNHFGICLNIGMTPSQLTDFVEIIEKIRGKKAAIPVRKALATAIELHAKKN